MTNSQQFGRLFYAAAPGVGHHGGHCWPFWSRRVGRRCCVVVSVFLLGKLASKHAPTNHGGGLPSRCLGSLHAEWVASLRLPIWYTMVVSGFLVDTISRINQS
jgi:hypothetical protein